MPYHIPTPRRTHTSQPSKYIIVNRRDNETKTQIWNGLLIALHCTALCCTAPRRAAPRRAAQGRMKDACTSFHWEREHWECYFQTGGAGRFHARTWAPSLPPPAPDTVTDPFGCGNANGVEPLALTVTWAEQMRSQQKVKHSVSHKQPHTNTSKHIPSYAMRC